MLKVSVKLLFSFLVFLCIVEIVELRKLRDDNGLFKDNSIKKLQTATENLSKFISRENNVLAEIEEKSKFIVKLLQKYQKFLKNTPPITNKIYVKLQKSNKKDDGKTFIDNFLKLSNKEMKVMVKNAIKTLTCPLGQVYINRKGCIPKKLANLYQEKMIRDLITGNEYLKNNESAKNKIRDYSSKLIQSVNRNNLLFELTEPYKLVKNENNAHVINNEFVKDKSSNIYVHPLNTLKSRDTIKKISQDKIKFKNPETINFGDTINLFYKYTIELEPKTKLTVVPVGRTDMINGYSKASRIHTFNRFKNLSKSQFISNKNRIQTLGSIYPKNIEFTYGSNLGNKKQIPLNTKNQTQSNTETKMTPSSRQSIENNFEIMALKKENEELKNLLSKVNLEKNLDKTNQSVNNSIETNRKIHSAPKNKFPEKIKNSIENPLYPVIKSEFQSVKEKDEKLPKTENSKFSDLLKKMAELDKQGKAKELNKFSENLSESDKTSQSSLSELIVPNLYSENESEEAVDEGEISNDSSVLDKAIQPENPFATPKSSPNAELNHLNSNKTELLQVKNFNPNVSNGTSISKEENTKINKYEPLKELKKGVTNKDGTVLSNLGMDKNLNITDDLGDKVSNINAKPINENNPKIKKSPEIKSTPLSATLSSTSNLTLEQPNTNSLSTVQNILENNFSSNQNSPKILSDFDDSTSGHHKQKSENVNVIQKVKPPSYDYKSVGEINDEKNN
ncbi:unnamed protein product [Chironomus riparius]|uniref:Uncharacterized protein n=1 Tax=Chironomus riparius TaxID=315576 RepID=A0A9N9WMF5_9DIPT|nr:unnamed protein product [Chironomus riparius]